MEKSVSAGFVQLTVTWAFPAVAEAAVTAAGERLSMVTVALAVSVPAWAFVPAQSATVPVTV